jgi:D-alanyl-lipoteichoic acid acyltransferase DltB (MBOAT superfamily)
VSFTTPAFGVFLVLTLIVWFALPARAWRARKGFLTVASWLFYLSWLAWPVLLLIATTIVDFLLGRVLERTQSPRRRRLLVATSVCTNLGILGYFKYAGWFVDSLLPTLDPSWRSALEIVLPVGISFYTFESLSYVIDVYRGAPACRRFVDFALFLSFFPHLVAGPIVRPWQFLPQLVRPRALDPLAVEEALARIAVGLTKKLLLADTLALTVDVVFTNPAGHAGAAAWIALYAYAFQIYFDFSGYTDIAIGTARLFGFVLPENFDRPYAAASLREFWQRWHISLSTWLRDYLYVPLGGNRHGRAVTYRNLLVTMVLGGLWHGAAWHFVLWGGYHGLLLGAERALGLGARPTTPAMCRVRQLITFHLVVFGWLLFRSETMTQMGAMLAALVTPALPAWGNLVEPLLLVLLAAAMHVGPRAADVRRAFVGRTPWEQGVAYATVVMAVVLFAPGAAPFIYFQF